MPLIVQIRQHKFDILREYQAGHICTAGEAAALNQMLIENIRNNVYGFVVREVRNSPGNVLTVNQQVDLQKQINQYVETYHFKSNPMRYRPMTPIESATRELARQEAEIWGQQNGYLPDSEEVGEKYKELLNNPEIIDRAREILRSHQTVAETLLEGLSDAS